MNHNLTRRLSEVRVSPSSFDIRQAPLTRGGYFIGDYNKITADSSGDFVAAIQVGNDFARPAQKWFPVSANDAWLNITTAPFIKDYPAAMAPLFGISVPSTGLPNAEVVLASPILANSALVNSVTGKIVIARQGTNTVQDKALKIQQAGAAAAIIYSSTATDRELLQLTGTSATPITIPVVGLSGVAGLELFNLLSNGTILFGQLELNRDLSDNLDTVDRSDIVFARVSKKCTVQCSSTVVRTPRTATQEASSCVANLQQPSLASSQTSSISEVTDEEFDYGDYILH